MITRSRFGCGALALAALLGVPSPGSAQLPGLENGEWHYLGGDAGHTRSSTLNQINASNFSKLEVAWIFRGDNFGPGLEYTARSTPVFALTTIAGAMQKGTQFSSWRVALRSSINFLVKPGRK